jgi:hypothetical protein
MPRALRYSKPRASGEPGAIHTALIAQVCSGTLDTFTVSIPSLLSLAPAARDRSAGPLPDATLDRASCLGGKNRPVPPVRHEDGRMADTDESRLPRFFERTASARPVLFRHQRPACSPSGEMHEALQEPPSACP